MYSGNLGNSSRVGSYTFEIISKGNENLLNGLWKKNNAIWLIFLKCHSTAVWRMHEEGKR